MTTFYFLIALFLLVIIHEFGHFILARYCGVKVLRFSFGFGKVLASWRDKRGTEFAYSLLPLGGYVKMLDESEGPVIESEKHLAFNNQSLLSRASIVAAGPLFNFLFAYFLLWLVLVIGTQSLAPIIKKVTPGSISASAGLIANQEIMSVNGIETKSWHDVQYAMMPLIGTNEPMILGLKLLTDANPSRVILPLTNWQVDTKRPDLLGTLGIEPFVPTVPMVVGDVMPDSPAFQADIRRSDVIHLVDGQTLTDWLALVNFVKQRPNQRVILTITRQGKHSDVSVLIGSKNSHGKVEGYLGVRSQPIKWPPYWLRTQKESPMRAAVIASRQTIKLIGDTFSIFGRLAQGKLSFHTLSGPVGIAQAAGASARIGLTNYLSFLALLSISLGVLNLLPIPLLDGGYLFYCLIELVIRRPVSEKIKSTGAFFGFFCMIALMLVALSNDIDRLIN
jgi:regulator of sigma E protease